MAREVTQTFQCTPRTHVFPDGTPSTEMVTDDGRTFTVCGRQVMPNVWEWGNARVDCNNNTVTVTRMVFDDD